MVVNKQDITSQFVKQENLKNVKEPKRTKKQFEHKPVHSSLDDVHCIRAYWRSGWGYKVYGKSV
jgi:hypothetical protein